ncbi:uncharacterized protein Fot_52213 [Forsythia ovata]|uniref:Uncharacterized protein n=1 Tax=Forsythia ovata TaxID=205694 RepID=A0ABD1PKR5_9LAMI
MAMGLLRFELPFSGILMDEDDSLLADNKLADFEASNLDGGLCENATDRFPSSVKYVETSVALGIVYNKTSPKGKSYVAMPSSVGDVQRRSSLESLFCYDKPIPEEIIEKPIGLSLALKNVGDNPHCPSCQAKGAVLCTTCSGSGLYVESILESQGIIVKVAGELEILCVRDVGVEVTLVLLDKKVMALRGNWEYCVFWMWGRGHDIGLA